MMDNVTGLCKCGCGQLAPIAKKTLKKTGQIKGQPFRYIRGHNAGLPRKKTDPIQRFMSKVDKSGGDNSCWSFRGSHSWSGYGIFNPTHDIHIAAHRYMYQIINGAIPEGMLICHKCDNPGCCNPIHLFLGTPTDNMRDKVRKGRQSTTIPKPRYGEAHHNCRFTTEDVKAMRDLHEKARWSQLRIAKLFDAPIATINGIVRYKARTQG